MPSPSRSSSASATAEAPVVSDASRRLASFVPHRTMPDLRTVRDLLADGADPDARITLEDQYDGTPIGPAASLLAAVVSSRGDPAIAAALLQAGADPALAETAVARRLADADAVDDPVLAAYFTGGGRPPATGARAVPACPDHRRHRAPGAARTACAVWFMASRNTPVDTPLPARGLDDAGIAWAADVAAHHPRGVAALAALAGAR